MEKVKVVKIFDVRTGVSRSSGKEWKSRDVLLESVQNVMYPEKWMANLFGDAVEKFTAKEGDIISVALHHDVNEKNGRYFNEVRIVEFGNNL